MSSHSAEIHWTRGNEPFTEGRYSRVHRWRFDGGTEVQGSASPRVVPLPFSSEAAVDPEEAFIASLSSCHMLWFLYLASKAGYIVDEYTDHATGVLGKNAEGKIAITRVTLAPKVKFSGATSPDDAEFTSMHHLAHEKCFIANSVKCEIICTPAMVR